MCIKHLGFLLWIGAAAAAAAGDSVLESARRSAVKTIVDNAANSVAWRVSKRTPLGSIPARFI
ncbi:hypothetical protein [Sphaerotilus montanus]|uniref:hypothetical protein n=1 Tax=Sphaerotilus montanus TaxID=522889 RepID=UPI003FA32762